MGIYYYNQNSLGPGGWEDPLLKTNEAKPTNHGGLRLGKLQKNLVS